MKFMKSMEIYQHISMEIIICFSFFIYNFETMIVKTDDQLKLEELKREGEPYTVNTSEHIPTGLAMSIYYIEDTKYKK